MKILVALISAALLSAPAFAQAPAGDDKAADKSEAKGGKHEKHEKQHMGRGSGNRHHPEDRIREKNKEKTQEAK